MLKENKRREMEFSILQATETVAEKRDNFENGLLYLLSHFFISVESETINFVKRKNE